MILTTDDFKKYLNEDNITIDELNKVLVEKTVEDEHSSSILIESKPNYYELITIEFSLRFKHHEYEQEGTVFQREFSIEHHEENRSIHTKPHLQFYIHGANNDNKVGELWLTLELENDKEYETCIKGFISILDDIADICKEGLDKELLNKKLVEALTTEKNFLLIKIKESLTNKQLEYRDSEGIKVILTPEMISEITNKDQTLIPFFNQK